jgi:DedD protein
VDFQMKQRLVGAIVLVALGVIFIPMLLEGPDRDLVPEMEPLPEPEEQAIGQPLERFPAAGEVPAQPERSVVQTDTAPDTEIEPAEAATGDGSASPAEALPLPEPEIPDSAEQETAPPETADEPAAGKPVAAGSQPVEPGPLGNWVVQMGSFSSEQNALRLRDRLRKAGFVTQVEKVLVNGKTLFRVRVGPYLERAEADGDQKKLAETFDLKGRVLAYP